MSQRKQYSVNDAARLLKVNSSRVRQRILAMVKEGYPEPEKFGGSWMLTERDLQELNRRKKAVGRPPERKD